MIIQNLTKDSEEYTSNVYHVTGAYRQITDLSTLIDVGRDSLILGELKNIKPGIGKKAIDQIFLTHSHFDHAGLLKEIVSQYPVPVYAHPESRASNIVPLYNNDRVQIGDQEFEVIWAGTHSEDSVCYFCHENGVLFSGDIPIRIYTSDGTFDPSYLPTYERIHSYDVQVIYPGHGDPITHDVRHLLDESYQNLKRSNFV